MDEAYKKFKGNMSYNDFIDNLTEKEKLAVLTGNLNYQVGNGGFNQWHLNEYSEKGRELVLVVQSHLKGVASKKVITILDDFSNEIDYLERQG